MLCEGDDDEGLILVKYVIFNDFLFCLNGMCVFFVVFKDWMCILGLCLIFYNLFVLNLNFEIFELVLKKFVIVVDEVIVFKWRDKLEDWRIVYIGGNLEIVINVDGKE